MELRSILRALARSWPVVAFCTLLGAGSGWAVTASTTPVYEARTQLFVSASAGRGTAELNQGSSFSVARVQSYAAIVTSRQVTDTVVQELGLPFTADQLAGRITAQAPAGTVLVDITVSDEDPERSAAVANEVARRFSRVVEELETPVGSKRSPVRLGITETAAVPGEPVSPSPGLNLSAGVLAGLLIGSGIAVARQVCDTTVNNVTALAELTGLPVLGAIPFDKSATRRTDTMSTAAHSARAEAFRHLRTNLQFAQIGERPRIVIVTSSLAGEGKTSTAINLALALTETGISTVLVDGDLRRPRVAQAFGLVQDAGLTSVLIGRAGVDEVMQQAAGALNVLTSGPVPPNPAELLASKRMGEVLGELAQRYEAVIVDSAPLLPVADTVGLGPLAQGALLVVRAGKTPRDRIRAAADSLHAVGARTLGTVLSMTPQPRNRAYGYGYGYGVGEPVPPLPAPRPRTTVTVPLSGSE
ncbi:polysaccharide biosynthesis tyrosine autokinase [Streptomyces sp. NPDC005181]|uniref:polysaccharide biosynthesis tyrosine autokinase n=1 Tax=Streptomyces sp. NPDC005181 TaxID=3156869 RepID=UPI0033A39E51